MCVWVDYVIRDFVQYGLVQHLLLSLLVYGLCLHLGEDAENEFLVAAVGLLGSCLWCCILFGRTRMGSGRCGAGGCLSLCRSLGPGRFCYGVDAVLLSWFAKAYEGERVLDFCTGTGVVPILMTAKTAASHFTGLEIQEEVAKMAAKTELINPQVKPAPDCIRDKHFFRKHGANAYYGQN